MHGSHGSSSYEYLVKYCRYNMLVFISENMYIRSNYTSNITEQETKPCKIEPYSRTADLNRT